MFAGILKYQGDSGEQIDDAQRIEIGQKLLHQGLKRPELKDELYMQLLKQTRCNPSPTSRIKAWELFHLVAASMPPSKVCLTIRRYTNAFYDALLFLQNGICTH
jgi:hypothetical protein